MCYRQVRTYRKAVFIALMKNQARHIEVLTAPLSRDQNLQIYSIDRNAESAQRTCSAVEQNKFLQYIIL